MHSLFQFVTLNTGKVIFTVVKGVELYVIQLDRLNLLFTLTVYIEKNFLSYVVKAFIQAS